MKPIHRKLAFAALAGVGLVVVLRPSKPAFAQAVEPAPRALSPTTSQQVDAILRRWTAERPTLGRYYQLREGDTLETIARAALSNAVGAHNRAQRLHYMWLVASVPTHAPYVTPSTSRQYPDAWRVPGWGKGIRVAFLPRNEDAREVMVHELRSPRQMVDPKTGAPLDSGSTSLGFLWLPPVDLDAMAGGAMPQCEGLDWPDGTSKLLPPPQLLALLEAPQ